MTPVARWLAFTARGGFRPPCKRNASCSPGVENRGEVSYIRSELACNTALAQVPVLVTENNVNSDFATSNGTSFCNGTPYVVDPRGSSAFFAAWRSLVFELLAKRVRRPSIIGLSPAPRKRLLDRACPSK